MPQGFWSFWTGSRIRKIWGDRQVSADGVLRAREGVILPRIATWSDADGRRASSGAASICRSPRS